jgi:hypothetical protein
MPVRAMRPAAIEINIKHQHCDTLLACRPDHLVETEEFRKWLRYLSGELQRMTDKKHDQDQRQEKQQSARNRSFQKFHPRSRFPLQSIH